MKLFKKAKDRFLTSNRSQNPSPTGSQVSAASNLLPKDTRDSVWEGVKTALRLINESAAAFPPLKSTVGGLLGIIDIVENSRQNAEEAGHIQRTLNAVAATLKSLKTTMDASVRIDGLVASINEQVILLQTIANRNRASAVANSTKDKDEIGAVVRKISDLFDVFLIETCLSTEAVSVETLDVVKKAYLRDELKPVVEAFYTSDGPVPRRLCTSKTREEILLAMMAWATSTDDKRIYCLSGMAGTGKTTIVNTLCRILERMGLLGGSFFCSRADTNCSSANRIIPSIIFQLSIRFPSFHSEIIKVIEKTEGGSAERSFRPLVVEPLKTCDPEIGGPTVIVIDALDECGNENEVATLLSHLWTHAPTLPVKFLLTFRPDRVFQSRLHLSDSSSTKLHLHDVEKSLVERDIRLFLKERLHQLADDQRARGIDVDAAWPADTELNDLHRQAGTLFIYAATTCEYIGSGGDVTERLSQVIQMGSNPTSLQTSSIDKLYTGILGEASRHLEQTEKDRLLRILAAVIYAQKSLTVQSLSTLLSIQAPKILASLDRLHSVLRLRTQEDGTVVSTLHASFPDYLGDPKRSHGYFCDLAQSNTMLTEACLTTMDALKENICELTEDSIPDHVDRQRIPESLQYACQFWPSHYYSSSFSGQLGNQLNHFFETHVLHWVECLSLLGILYPSIHALQKIETGVYQSVLRDTRRFISQSIELLKSNPLETYKSALVWPPMESYIRRKYFRALSLPKILSGLPKYWDSCEIVLTGHSHWITSVAYSRDGSRIVSGSDDNTVRVWNSSTGECEHELTGHSQGIRSVAFSPDGSHIVSGSSDNTVRVWNSATGESGHELTGHSEAIMSVAFSPDSSRIVSGSDDKTVRVWNSATGESEHKLTGHSKAIRSVAFSPDGSRIVSGSNDNTVRVWNSATGESEHKLTGHSHWIVSVAFSPDGSHIVSGSSDNTVRVWNSATGESGHELTGHSEAIMSVAFSPDSSRIVSGSDDNTVRVWNSATGESEHKLTGHSGLIRSVAFSPDGSRIVSGSDDKTVRVWNSATGESEHELTGHSGLITSVAFSPDGSRIVSGSADKTVRVWNSAIGESEHELTGHSGLITSVSFSPDGSRIVSGSADKTVRVCNSATGESEHELTGHFNAISCVVFSPDGSRIVSGSFDSTVRVWNSATGESEVLSTKIILPDQTVVQCQPHGQYLILPQHPNTTPHTMLSMTDDDRWLVISSKQSRYWIPPSYSQISGCWFFDNLAVLGYITGKLIIFAVDK